MNNKPWSQPTIVTACGMPAKYFNGMATPSNSRNETPSTRPMARRRPMDVRNMEILWLSVMAGSDALATSQNVFSQQSIADSIPTKFFAVRCNQEFDITP
jgi:hypothetical protein